MQRVSRTWLIALAALPVAALAQEPQARQGFGISFGLGGGSGDVECDVCISDRAGGFSGYLRLGGYVRPDLFVAFESNGYSTSGDDIDTSGGFYSVALQWYPNVQKGFYLKGNLGVVGVKQEDDVGDELTAGAFGMGIGIGYDFRVGRNFSLTPYANLIFSGDGEVEFNGSDTGVDAKFNLVQIGLGFTWH